MVQCTYKAFTMDMQFTILEVRIRMRGEYSMAGKADTSITIRMNRDVKQQAQQIFSDLGMDMSTAINIFLRQVISFKGLPFEVALHAPNEVTLAAMDAAEHDKDMHGPFESVASLMEALDA